MTVSMKRDLGAMAAKSYDIVVIGGGITGACIARDAALRGLSVALVEKNDFASATTAASSKLIHGGLRYLQHLELRLVRESLRERRIWSNVAPHLVDPLTFLLPMTRRRLKDRLVKALGLTLYDWLAYDRNRLEDPEKTIPKHKALSRKEVLELEPGFASSDLTGAMMFYDYQMYSPERLALECIRGAVERGADAANYAEVTEFIREGESIVGVRVHDRAREVGEPDSRAARESGGIYAIKGRVVVNAAGPWADILMNAMRPGEDGGAKVPSAKSASRHLLRSKGIHLLTRPVSGKYAVAVLGEGNHFFILPWRGYSLLGTTDTVYEGNPDEVHATEKDIVDFLAIINKGFPSAKLVRSDVKYFYAGLRPIVDTSPAVQEKEGESNGDEEDEPDTYTASRAAEVYDHEVEEGLKGAITAIGGKWTTSRSLAEQVVDMAAAKLGMDEPPPCTTAEAPVHGGDVGPYADFEEKVLAEHPTMPPDVVKNLARNHGSHLDDVLALVKENSRWGSRLCDRHPDIGAQIVYAVRNEMALTVEDVLFRRTGLGTAGSPGDGAISRVADIMAEELEWDGAQRSIQVERAVSKFVSWARTLAIVNPHSWGDRTGSIWPSIEAKLRHAMGPIESVFTDAPMAAKHLTSQALKNGMEQIIAVGGDGTVNEVVNGFFENGKAINPEAVLAVLNSGTGCDFARSFEIPESVDRQVDRLAVSTIRSLDLGRLTFVNQEGVEETRYFANIASFGLSGTTDREVNRLRFGKWFSGQTSFFWGMLKALMKYRSQPVHIRVDDAYDQVVNICTAAVCNGAYFGSGMKVAPQALTDDGMFDVVIISSLWPGRLLMNIGSVYDGSHIQKPHVTALRGRKITAEPAEGSQDVFLDVDGETPGRLPATFEIVPGAVYFRC